MSKLHFRTIAGLSWLLVALIFCFSLWLVEPAAVELPQPDAALPIDRTIQTAATKDRGRPVRLLEADGSVSKLTMEDYLWRVVAAEMPASFEPEALKAQACAARTYTVRLQNSGGKHETADICTDSKCCQACILTADAMARWGLEGESHRDKIARAVAETDGLGILYGGRPIQALYFSSAPGATTDAVAVWGNAVDYLKSVTSPEGDEVPNYRTQVVLSRQEVKDLLLAAYPGADFSGEPEGWFSQIVRNESGAVTSLLAGGITLTGNQVRGALGLRSPAFTVAYADGSFTFDVTGYGHGVGMSQYGANAMAKEGRPFREILTWYYTGAEVAALW